MFGERITPSDAGPPAPPADGVVHYYFPVEIEVVGDSYALVQQVAAEVFSELDRELSSRQ